MVILILLVALFIVFFMIRHRIGPAHLAVIAGISVYEMFGGTFTDFLHKLFDNVPTDTIQTGVYVALIALFPLLLYLRSPHGGMIGIIRFAESAVFAALLTSLLAPTVSQFFAFDTIATTITDFISLHEPIIILAGIISAYLDILLYHD